MRSGRPDRSSGGTRGLEALKRLGREEVECRIIAGLSEAGYKALGLSLNKLPEGSRWDDDILREVISEIQDEGENALSLGFSPNELNKILAEPDDLEVKEIETGPVEDECWFSIRAPLKHQAELNKRLNQLISGLDGATCDIGVINVG